MLLSPLKAWLERRPPEGQSRFREGFEPLETTPLLLEVMREVSSKTVQPPSDRGTSSRQSFSAAESLNQPSADRGTFPPQSPALSAKASLCRQRLEQGLEIRFNRGENETTDSLLTLVPDYDKPLPALPCDKPLPPLPEIKEEFVFFFDTAYRTCGFAEGNDEREYVQDFGLWIETEDCQYCRTEEEEDMEGLNIKEADIMW
jgi:hypothetical protein